MVAQLIFALLISVQPVAPQITLTDGRIISSAWKEIRADRLELSDGKVVEIDRVERIEFGKREATAGGGGPGAVLVTLRDGSTVRCEGLTIAGRGTQLHLPSLGKVDIEPQCVANIQLAPLDSDQAAAKWQSICQSELSSDMIVLKRGEGQLEAIEGLVNAMDIDKVQFDLGGQVIDVPLERLAGVRLFSTSQPAKSDFLCVVEDRAGSRWRATSIRAGIANLTLTLAAGGNATLPVRYLEKIDFSVGRSVSLTELSPLKLSAATKPQASVLVAGAEEMFAPRVIEYQLPDSPIVVPAIEFLGDGSVSYRLPEKFSQLQCTVSLRPRGSHFTPCKARITMNNEVVWEALLDQPRKLESVDVPVAAGARVELSVISTGMFPVGSSVIWQSPRLLK